LKLNFSSDIDLTKPTYIPATQLPKKLPIILLHGSSGNQFEWFNSLPLIKTYLPHHDIFAYTLDLETDFNNNCYTSPPSSLLQLKKQCTLNDLTIEEYTSKVNTIIQHVMEVTEQKQVILIGHSMGGLLALNCLYNDSNTDKIHKIVCISSPLQGTPRLLNPLAKLILKKKRFKQITPKSSFLTSLHTHKPIHDKIITFGSYQDIQVPNDHAKLDGVDHFTIDGIGHLNIHTQEDVWIKISEFLY
jgi:pimeloyl-ACP methyl ester carboxylesterase